MTWDSTHGTDVYDIERRQAWAENVVALDAHELHNALDRAAINQAVARFRRAAVPATTIESCIAYYVGEWGTARLERALARAFTSEHEIAKPNFGWVELSDACQRFGVTYP